MNELMVPGVELWDSGQSRLFLSSCSPVKRGQLRHAWHKLLGYLGQESGNHRSGLVSSRLPLVDPMLGLSREEVSEPLTPALTLGTPPKEEQNVY